LSIEDGLAGRVVNIGLQDSRGFIWLATNYGLNRYDGQELVLYTKEKNGLQDNSLRAMAEDDKGRLWLFYGIPGREDGLSGKVDLIDIYTWAIAPPDETLIDRLLLDQNLSYATAGPAGQLILFYANGTVITYFAKNDHLVTAEIPPGMIQRVVPVETGVWASTGEGVLAFIANDGQASHCETPGIDYPYLVSANGKGEVFLFAQRDTPLRIIPASVSIFRCNLKGECFKTDRTLDTSGRLFAWPPSIDHFACNASTKQCWLTVKNEGVFMYPANGRPQVIVGKADLEHYPGINIDSRIFFSQSHTWISTSNGVFSITAQPNRFTHYLKPQTERSNQVRGIAEDGKGNLIVADIQGLHEVSITDGSKQPLPEDLTGPDYAFAILREKNTLWVSTTHLRAYDSIHRKVTIYGYAVPSLQPEIWDLFRNKGGRLWLATGSGLAWLDESREKIVRPEEKGFKNYTDHPVYHFCETRNGEVWLAATSGIYRFDEARGMIDHHGETETGDRYLPLLQACWIHEDAEGVFWMATRGHGLVKWDRNEKAYRQFTVSDGLSSNVVYTILEDDHGNLWIGSDYGLMKFNKAAHHIRTYTMADGLTDNEFNRTSAYKAADGRMYFGTMRGVNAFYPEDLLDGNKVFDAPLQVTEFRQFIGTDGRLRESTNSLALKHKIVLRPGDRFFTIKVQLLDYSTGKHRYAYRLEGLDQAWHYIEEPPIRVSDLPYGDYRLQIKGQDATGHWSASVVDIPVGVLKPFYLESGFLLLCLIFLSGSIYGGYRWRVSRLEAEKMKLEKVVAERTTDLQQSLREKEVLLKEIHHRLKNNLQMISSLLDLQSNELTDDASNQAFREGQSRVRSIALVHQHLYQQKELTGLEIRGFTKDLFEQLRSMLMKKGQVVEMAFTGGPKVFDIDTAIPLGLMLNEMITNSFKHAFDPARPAMLRLELQDLGQGAYELHYWDGGPGFPPELELRKVRSLGLRLIYTLSRQLGGRASINNENGSLFSIRFMDTATRKAVI